MSYKARNPRGGDEFAQEVVLSFTVGIVDTVEIVVMTFLDCSGGQVLTTMVATGMIALAVLGRR